MNPCFPPRSVSKCPICYTANTKQSFYKKCTFGLSGHTLFCSDIYAICRTFELIYNKRKNDQDRFVCVREALQIKLIIKKVTIFMSFKVLEDNKIW